MLALDGRVGLHGYQWLFLLEGAPTVLLGLFLAATLADQPLTVRPLMHCVTSSSRVSWQ